MIDGERGSIVIDYIVSKTIPSKIIGGAFEQQTCRRQAFTAHSFVYHIQDSSAKRPVRGGSQIHYESLLDSKQTSSMLRSPHQFGLNGQ